MAMSREQNFVSQIVHAARRLGWQAIPQSGRGGFSVFGWPDRGRKEPDIVLRRGGRSIIVVVSTRPVIVYDIHMVRLMRDQYRAEAIICLPEVAYRRTRTSAKSFAREVEVRLIQCSEDNAMLNRLLR